MKLLSPFAQKDKQQEELTRKLLRIQEITELEIKTNANLARAQADFNDTLARNRDKWSIEESEHSDRIKDMTQEVESLENRKKEALIPVQMYKDEVDKMYIEAQELVKNAKEKEEQADYLAEKLEEKLTEVGDREKQAEKEEQKLEIAKQGIEAQKEQIKEGIKKLSEEMIMFHEKQQYEETSLNKRKSEVALAEINFNAKLEKYERDIEAMKIWDKQLKDERGVLDREYARRNK